MVDAAFNHAYAVLDRSTADAIAASALLRYLGAFEVRTTTADGLTWTGRYLRGRSTYIEIFGEGDINAPVGATGVALSPDLVGGLAVIEQRLRSTGDGTTTVTLVTADRSSVGLRRLDLSLSTPVPLQVEDLGSSHLTVGPGATATWEFNGA